VNFSTLKTKQFDLGHVTVDEKLQGAQLASFTQRWMAFAIDWLLIWASTHFMWLFVPLLLVLLIVKGRLQRAYVKNRRMLKKSIAHLETRLNGHSAAEERFYRQLSKGAIIYLKILLFAPVVLASIYFLVVLFQTIFPQQYLIISAYTETLPPLLTRPVSDLSSAVTLVAKFFGAFLYFTLFTWKWRGQTPGKRLFKIRAVKLNGRSLTLYNTLERAAGYTASASILFLGFFQYFWDRNSQTTHDKIAETIVVKD
jgi:uncharacterized RDD family membrane protein YckC